MSEELKPCPFCGGEADPDGWMNGDGECGPECESCGATASSVIVWNRRAELTAIKAGQGEAVAWQTVCSSERRFSVNKCSAEERGEHWRENGRGSVAVEPLFAAPPATGQGEVVDAVIGFYENEREPRLLSWNVLPHGEHRLYTAPPATDGAVSMPMEFVRFLLGEGDLNGYSFGDMHQVRVGKFWWRTELRALLALQEPKP